MITGLPAEAADVFIRNAVDEQESSGAFRAGGRTASLTESGCVVMLRVEDRSGLTAAARMGDFEALQLVARLERSFSVGGWISESACGATASGGGIEFEPGVVMPIPDARRWRSVAFIRSHSWACEE